MMFIQTQVPRRALRCVKSGELFEPESSYVSCLIAKKEGQWQREDYCLACWKQVEKAPHVLHWQGKVPSKKEKSKESADEKALTLFRELLIDPENRGSIFILALYLERKKQLVLRGELEGKVCFELPQTGELFILEKVLFKGNEPDEIICSLLEKLC